MDAPVPNYYCACPHESHLGWDSALREQHSTRPEEYLPLRMFLLPAGISCSPVGNISCRKYFQESHRSLARTPETV